MPDSSGSDWVRLINMVFYAYHGAAPEEARLGQKFQLDVELEMDLEAAGRTDELERTVNCQEGYQLVADTVQGRRYQLLEALVQAVATSVLERYEMVKSAVVRVRKPSVPLGGVLDHTEVEIRRRR